MQEKMFAQKGVEKSETTPHSLVLGLLVILKEIHKVQSNRESG